MFSFRISYTTVPPARHVQDIVRFGLVHKQDEGISPVKELESFSLIRKPADFITVHLVGEKLVVFSIAS